MKRYKTAVFLGRFQPVHNAHLKIIQEALEIADEVIIGIGTAHRPRTIKNPWTAEEREAMIRRAIATHLDQNEGWSDKPDPYAFRTKFIHVRDHMYNNAKWASEVYSKALQSGATQDKDTVLVGCFKDESSFYLKMFPQWDLHKIKLIRENDHIVSSTDVRGLLLRAELPTRYVWQLPPAVKDHIEEVWLESPVIKELKDEFKHLMEYKKQFESLPYEPTFVTVDTVVVRSGHVLLVQRKNNPGKGLWALPGGFLNTNEKIEDGAIRELKEETKIEGPKEFLKSRIKEVKVFDHPNRSLRGRTITHAHLLDLGEGPLPTIKAADDAKDAHWFPLMDVYKMEDKLFEDHSDIIQYMTGRF